jgi:methyl-accepting chemotaxis protein
MSNSTMWIRRFSIRLRMQCAIVMVLGLFSLVGLTGVVGGRHLAELNSEFMLHSIKEVHNVGAIRAALGEVRHHEKDMVIHYEDTAAVISHRQAWRLAVDKAQTGLRKLLEGEEDTDNPLARTSSQEIDAYAAATSQVLDQIQSGAYDNARAADRMLTRAKQHIQAVETNVDAIDKIVSNEANDTQREFEVSMRQTLWCFVGVLGLVMAMVVPLTLLNSRSIIGPMQQARDLALAIADGDLHRVVPVDGQDEASALLRALAQMQAALAGLVGEVRQASGSIHHAADEVAAGNTDLSGRTEQAAGNLQQTAGAVQQITRSVQQSVSSAGHACDLAASACSVAERGGAVVAQVVSTMDEINSSSGRIADIIGTIDGIAFQTNILALNAAVEAARAGEQGRGFAVVASEVRNLAQRSAGAAREIKGLISASVASVDAGARLVKDAGSTMSDIVTSVRHVTDTIRDITHAAGEQSQGIGSVNDAINSLDQMTQQNAALVEQSAAAAESLRDQASKLTAVVARFRLAPA